MRLGAQRRHQTRVAHAQGLAPQVAHLAQLAQERHERRGEHRQAPREAPHRYVADDAPNGGDHLRPILVEVAVHVKRREPRQAGLALDELHHRLGDVRQIAPLVTDAASGIADAAQRRPRLDQALREPVVCRAGAEEVAGADDEHALSRVAQATLHLDANGALARRRVLRRLFVDAPAERIRPVVVDGAGQDHAGAARPRGGDRALEHRQDQLAPVAIAGRIDRVHDERRAARGRDHVVGAHGVAGHHLERRVAQAGRVAMQGAHPPATGAQEAGHGLADAAGDAENECGALVH